MKDNTVSNNWRTPPAPIPEEQIASVHQADVMVVGLGFAGTAALRGAAEAGAQVIGIERQLFDKFNAWGRDIGHINSKFLESRGVPKVDCIEYFNEWMRRAGNRANPSLIMKFVRNSGVAFDWYTDMVEDFSSVRVAFWPIGKKFDGELSGYKFWPGTAQFTHLGPGGGPDDGPEDGPGPIPDPADDDGDGRMPGPPPGSGGPFDPKNPDLTTLTRANQEKAEALGAELFFGIEAMQLVKDGDRVTGVIGKDRDGTYHLYKGSRGIILSTGDFAANKEMMLDLAKDVADLRISQKSRILRAGRNGRGIQMGVWAGGRLEAGVLPTMGGNFTTLRGFNATHGILWLDTNGKRYCNEVFGDPVMTGFPANQMKRGIYYSLFDSDVEEDLEWAAPAHESYDKEYAPMLREAMAAAVAAGKGGEKKRSFMGKILIVAGSNMDELLDNAGFEGVLRENVRASIERYNELCKGGCDEDFGKDAKLLRPLDKWPLFIQFVDTTTFSPMLCTVGGLLTDENQNVLDIQFEKLPGLYATGNCCGRRFGVQYSTPTAGVSIGIAITLGREAGIAAARLG